MRRAQAIAAAVLVLAITSPAEAQPREEDESFDLGTILETVVDGLGSLVSGSTSSFFDLVESIELLNAEAEIDRLVGNPWQLNDATYYKLSLLPYHIRYPIYRQLVKQLTRQDVLRSRRIHSITVDSARIITLDLETLDWNPTDEVVPGVSEDVQESLLTHFDTREIVDLTFYTLAQRDFFPDNEVAWARLKRTLAEGAFPLAIAALVAGAAFDKGALGTSGTVVKRGHTFRVGWYGGFRKLGFSGRPVLRGGLTTRTAGVELAAGLADQIDPTDEERGVSLELAVREGWLNNLVARRVGWDAFFEGALRRVLDAGPEYAGEETTARAGLFLKRENLFRNPNLTLRASAELESDLGDEVRYSVSVGFERPRSGMMLLLQASRERARSGDTLDETRAGIFLAGTMEPPASGLVEETQRLARRLTEEWELGGEADATDDALARVATLLADYVESRRLSYGTLRMRRRGHELYGPLDTTLLLAARDALVQRLASAAASLEREDARFDLLRRHEALVRREIRELERDPAAGSAVDERLRELRDLARQRQERAARAGATLAVYDHISTSLLRIRAVAGPLLAGADLTPLPRAVSRRLVLETTSPW